MVLACLLQVIGHIKYNLIHESRPNLTSWTIWGVTSFIDALNYSELTGDWQKNALALTCAITCAITWIVCLARGRFRKPEIYQYGSLLLYGVILILWKQFGLVKESNFILQIDNAISFIPIISGVVKDPTVERPAPWIWWTASYALGTLVVILRYEQWNDLLYPLSCAILHGLIAALATRKVKKQKH